MFQKNFDAQKNQDQTTDKFCFAFIFASEEVANDNSDDREYKGCDTNNTNCFNDRSIKKSKRDADRQRVDARRNGEREHRPKRERIVELLRLPARFLYHIGADEGEQHEGNPVVNARDVLLEPDAERIAEQRHQKLKAAEVRTGGTGVRKF